MAELDICGSCRKSQDQDEEGEQWVECSSCEQWYHNKCVALEKAPGEDETWLCVTCGEKVRLEELKKKKMETVNDQHNDDLEDADALKQIELMASLIKEKEELCAIKQKQLELMSQLSEKNKSANVKKFVDQSSVQFLGESSKNSRDAKVTIRKKVLPKPDNSKHSQPVQQSSVDSGGDNHLSQLMEKQMKLMSQQYLAELPEFDGDIDMWPIFYHQYLTTTERGDFDDAFNMIRLRKCLKGEARQAVAGILAMPNCLQNVINVLEKRFGSYEVIVKKKLSKLASLTPPNENKPQTVKQFYEFLLGFDVTLKSANAEEYLQSPQTIDAIIDKLPPNITRSWKRFIRDFDNRPTLEEFLKWFEPYYDCAVECDKEVPKAVDQTNKRNRVNTNSDQLPKSGQSTKPTSTDSQNQCKYCRKANHTMIECKNFQKSALKNRWYFVRRRSLCFTCLLGKHRQENCSEKKACGIDGCSELHHKLLHNSKSNSTSTSTTAEKELEPTNDNNLSAMTSSESSITHYRSLPVVLYNPENGKSLVTWAFLDEGSSPTMISNEIAEELGLDGEREELCTAWTDDTVRKDENSKRVKLLISGVGLTRKFSLHNVRTVSQLKLPLPSAVMDLKCTFDHLSDVDIPNVPISRPSILIGLEHAKLGLMYEIREGRWNEPVASRTRLGWVIHGKSTGVSSIDYMCHVCDCKNPDELSNLMHSFYSTESFGVSFKTEVESKENLRAREIMEVTTKHDKQQYETGLLWRRDDVTLPESKSMAIKRLMCFEQKLKRDEKLMAVIKTKMLEHINKGYLIKLNSADINEIGSHHWYLPLFSVINPHKPEKPRLVFDAAAKSHGVCLNDLLWKGPEMQVTLFGIMMRFRLRKIAITADIAEMFHRVKIIERDQNFQLILWRNCDEKKPIEVYKMSRMTFGATCSPCSANYVKNENAKRFSDMYPRAVQAIIQNHYVDDLLECFDDEVEALTVAQQIKVIHADAGFNIRNWISNSKMIESKMNSPEQGVNEINLDVSDESVTEKILGMFWSTREDHFLFKVNMNRVNSEVVCKQRLPTKREMLKIIMSQFDPLGILAPVIVFAKILMQEVWKHGSEWDDKIPSILEQKWFDWLDALQQVTHVRVARCYFHESEQNRKKMSLHLFADASEEAFATVAYVQVESSHGIYSSFVAAKSRVAPQKTLSIPRLELQAAVMAIRLKNSIVKELAISFNDVIFWTDSQTVLGWIRSTSRKYSVFVSHRVSEILDSSTICQWRWIPTKVNVADEATRSAQMPMITGRWLNGPEFLNGKENWPEEKQKVTTTNEEVKLVGVNREINLKTALIATERFSKYERLLRCTSFVLRFANKLSLILKQKERRSKPLKFATINEVPPLMADELNAAEKLLYKIVQHDHYSTEIRTLLTTGQQVSRNSKIYNLNPVLDEHGILRMASRIEAAPAIVDAKLKQPIILHQDHQITKLLIDSIHRKFHHVNKESVANHIRQYLWVPKIRAQINKVVRGCTFCKNRLAKPMIPRMAPLPESRLCAYQPPFSSTGVDFFGPIEVTIGRRHEKRWGVLFVCLTMRAIHIELAASLDTGSAIMCVRNFMNRRGPPLKMLSDNGTNFRAAEKELKKAVEEIDFHRMQEELTHPLPNETRTTWEFIPPSAPHFGGSWERMIRTVKQSLYIILKNKYPKEETLRSALIEIENLVNSRPLYYSPNDADNPEAITPNHLLRGSGYQVVPLMGDYDCRKQWKIAQSLANEFWRRWLYEYLPTISKRSKWIADLNSIQIGQVVLIVDNTIQRGEWRRGLVTKVFPSKDGRIRTVEVRTCNGTYLRPVAKLAIINLGPSL